MPAGHGTVYWHLLLNEYHQVRVAAKELQGSISHFNGFHMTPEKWLHVTTLIAGSTDEVSAGQMKVMISEAQKELAEVEPIPVTFGRILYHPEAIMLGVKSEHGLEPILIAVQRATRMATGKNGAISGSLPQWTPHATVSYSTAEQPAEPIISMLGTEVPPCDVTINAVSLIIQWGPERLWNWEVIGTARLGTQL
jgi:2'-5' RNA ligase